MPDSKISSSQGTHRELIASRVSSINSPRIKSASDGKVKFKEVSEDTEDERESLTNGGYNQLDYLPFECHPEFLD